ncbi:GntR family transcriptional regulator [Streptomyces sp. CNQ085]|uniref:GntR family transcriptional regulator n=1 Tax=Streptomyces sp. CNQ085 TaxID=2886944 RepID=UPI001F50B7E4|nr:GntR family transcriptional regulator [Streptomyces sp. CNQ085]MCI0383487.1 GntR family transcriptional regulator [Streptomyces sp. CNQ085]
MIQRSTLRAQIADALRDEVLAGRLPAGRGFTVKEIAEQYGVSATPVREALVDLSAQGLLDVEQHRGFRVHVFTSADYRAMVQARALVAEGVFRGSAGPDRPAPGDERLASVRRRAEAAERAVHAGDLDVLIGYDLRFWRELGELRGNPYITEFLDRLRVRCWVFAVPHLRERPGLRNVLWTGYRELAEAVAHGDDTAAGRLVAACDELCLALVGKLE